MGEFGFRQRVQKLPKNKGKVLFYETYFEQSNINRKPLIWSQDMIITKFGQEKKGEFGKRYKNCTKNNINQIPLIYLQR